MALFCMEGLKLMPDLLVQEELVPGRLERRNIILEVVENFDGTVFLAENTYYIQIMIMQ